MKASDIIGSLYWRWGDKHMLLRDLTDSQLKHIKNYVQKYPGFHNSRTSEAWYNDINYLLNTRIAKPRVVDPKVKISKVYNSTNKFFRKVFPEQLKDSGDLIHQYIKVS